MLNFQEAEISSINPVLVNISGVNVSDAALSLIMLQISFRNSYPFRMILKTSFHFI